MTVALMMLLACAAVGSLVFAQAPGGAAPAGPEGMGLPGAPNGPAAPWPAAHVGLSLTYADPASRMSQDELLSVIAYLASDPELRKQSDYKIPSAAAYAGGFGLADGAGMLAPITRDMSMFVGSFQENPKGAEMQVIADGADQRALLQAAAQRIVEALTANKLPKDQRDKRLREIDEKIANIQDKKKLLSTVAANTAKLGPEILKDRIKAAELERQRLEMDLAAGRVRSEAIAKEIDRVRRQAEEKLQTDAVLKQLREVVKLREEERARMKQLYDSGTAPRAELTDAEEKTLNANMRITEREEAIRQSTNSSLLERLNAELASNMINRAEMEVRLELIRRQQPSIDVKDLDEEKLDRLTDEYRALFRNPGTLPPLYYQLEKQQMDLRAQKLELLVTDVKAGDVTVTTQPAR
jgi:hypothetical protein